jgi:hypothetical protein
LTPVLFVIYDEGFEGTVISFAGAEGGDLFEFNNPADIMQAGEAGIADSAICVFAVYFAGSKKDKLRVVFTPPFGRAGFIGRSFDGQNRLISVTGETAFQDGFNGRERNHFAA